MTKYIQRKDGKMAGSIGDGKTKTPTTAEPLPASPTTPSRVKTVDTTVDKLLNALNRVTGPSNRREHERLFAARLAQLDTVTPVQAAYLQNAYRRAEQATNQEDELNAQRDLINGVANILYPTATQITFTTPYDDAPVINTITDLHGHTLYTASSSDNTRYAATLETLYSAYHRDLLERYFTPTTVNGTRAWTHTL